MASTKKKVQYCSWSKNIQGFELWSSCPFSRMIFTKALKNYVAPQKFSFTWKFGRKSKFLRNFWKETCLGCRGGALKKSECCRWSISNIPFVNFIRSIQFIIKFPFVEPILRVPLSFFFLLQTQYICIQTLSHSFSSYVLYINLHGVIRSDWQFGKDEVYQIESTLQKQRIDITIPFKNYSFQIIFWWLYER